MWWQYIIIAAVILFGIYGFLTLTSFETRLLSRRTSRTAADLYPRYADSVHKQRRHAKTVTTKPDPSVGHAQVRRRDG